MRKMRELFKENERVWFWITDEWKVEFYKELVEFEAKYNNGTDITLESLGNIMAVWRDGNVGYVSYFIWDMSFGNSLLNLIRVDYEKYRSGEKEYQILKSNVTLMDSEKIKN